PKLQEFYDALSLPSREDDGISYYLVNDVAEYLRKITALRERMSRLEEGLLDCSLRIKNEECIGKESTYRFFEDERLLGYMDRVVKVSKGTRTER
ncbi:MAG: hypothetical protein Q7K45_04400, partial [Nanoarchaeota archaeon]|nr:hypothetical protein [Nanoarchaeota archaeon]